MVEHPENNENTDNLPEIQQNTSKVVSKGGRPKTPVDKGEVYRLAAIGCTIPEIASIVGMSTRGLESRIKVDQEIDQAIRQGRANAKMSLRRSLLKQVEKGNAAVSIFMAKNWLGMRDNPVENVQTAQPQKIIFETRQAVSDITITVGQSEIDGETVESEDIPETETGRG